MWLWVLRARPGSKARVALSAPLERLLGAWRAAIEREGPRECDSYEHVATLVGLRWGHVKNTDARHLPLSASYINRKQPNVAMTEQARGGDGRHRHWRERQRLAFGFALWIEFALDSCQHLSSN